MGYIYFWKPNGEYGFLSQWYLTRFEENGIIFSSAEQYMMYKKALLFNSDHIADKILNTNNPKDIRTYGRMVYPFEQAIWDKEKYNIVIKGNLLKFNQNQELLSKLLKTGNNTLVEASPFDKIWGIGMDKKLASKVSESDWNGLNLLGKALMDVRTKLSNNL